MLKGFKTFALTMGGCPMSVITLLIVESKIGSFSGFDQRDTANKSVVGFIMMSSLGIADIVTEKGVNLSIDNFDDVVERLFDNADSVVFVPELLVNSGQIVIVQTFGHFCRRLDKF